MMTDPTPAGGFSSTSAQRAAVLIGTVVLLLLGAGLTFATGSGSSRDHSAPASIASDRALDATATPVLTPQPSAPTTASATKAKKAAPAQTRKRDSSAADQDRGSAKPASRDESEKKKPSAREEDEDDDDHETVRPPVRDDDDDDREDSEGSPDESSRGEEPSD